MRKLAIAFVLLVAGIWCIAQDAGSHRLKAQFNGCAAGFCQNQVTSAATCASVLPGLVLDLDASNAASVIRSGSNVTQWNDLSGNGNNFPATSNPTYSATGFAGSKPGVTVVAATPSFVKNTAFPFNSATMSIFVVFVPTAVQNSNDGFTSFQASGQTDDFTSQTSFVMSEFHGAGNIDTASGSYTVLSFSSPTAGTAHVYGNVFDGTNGTEYLDFTAGTPAAHTGTFTGPAIFTFGTRPWNGNTPSWDGTYGEIIMTTSALNSTQLSTLHSCLSTKWGTP